MEWKESDVGISVGVNDSLYLAGRRKVFGMNRSLIDRDLCFGRIGQLDNGFEGFELWEVQEPKECKYRKRVDGM